MPSTAGIVSAASNLKNPAEPRLLGYRVNYVENPSFEVNTEGWVGYNGGTITRTTSQTQSGTYSLQVNNQSASGVQYIRPDGSRIPFLAGAGTYTYSLYIKLAEGNSTANYYLRHLQYETAVSSTTVASGNVGTQTLSYTGNWVRLSGQVTKAEAANYFVLRVLTNSTSPTDVFYLDSVLFEYGNSAGTYFDGSLSGSFWTGTPHSSFSGSTPYQIGFVLNQTQGQLKEEMMTTGQLPNWFANDGLPNFATHLITEFKDKPTRFLQIGAYTGDASLWLAQNVLTHQDSVLVDVDTWEGSDEPSHHEMNWGTVEAVYDAKTKYFQQSRKIVKFKGTSDWFFKNNREVYDFIYIDGDHTSYGVIKDAVSAYECLNVGGILAFDDYQWSAGLGANKEPRMAIDAFSSIYQDRVSPLLVGYQAWFRKVI